MKLPSIGRKFKVFLLTSGLVMAAGLIVKPASIDAVCHSITAVAIAMIVGHTATDMKNGKKAEAEESS